MSLSAVQRAELLESARKFSNRVGTQLAELVEHAKHDGACSRPFAAALIVGQLFKMALEVAVAEGVPLDSLRLHFDRVAAENPDLERPVKP